MFQLLWTSCNGHIVVPDMTWTPRHFHSYMTIVRCHWHVAPTWMSSLTGQPCHYYTWHWILIPGIHIILFLFLRGELTFSMSLIEFIFSYIPPIFSTAVVISFVIVVLRVQFSNATCETLQSFYSRVIKIIGLATYTWHTCRLMYNAISCVSTCLLAELTSVSWVRYTVPCCQNLSHNLVICQGSHV